VQIQYLNLKSYNKNGKNKVFFEYEIYTPFYSIDNFYFIEINDLLQNEYLINEIEEIEKMFQETYNDEYPPEPLHEDNLRKYIFVNRVLVSARLLQKELEGKYIFYFEWERWENELKRLEQEIGL
jgi:hypothetical protein